MDEFKKTLFDPPKTKSDARYEVITRRTKPFLLIVEGKEKGKEFQINKEPFIIGRDRSNDLCIDDPRVSRKHASIFFYEGKYRLKDLDSTNGTYLNNIKITVAKLNDRDRIQVGDTVLQFFIGDIFF